MEYSGTWKQSHYFVKNAFAPLLVSGIVDKNGTMQASITSDINNDISINCTVSIMAWDQEGPKH